MVFEVMREVRNTFYDGYSENGSFCVDNGNIVLQGEYWDSCYVLIHGGQHFGVYKMHKNAIQGAYTIEEIIDGSFNGSVYRLDVPSDFIRLVKEIEEYVRKTPESNIISERFGDYSYSISKDTQSWEKVFSTRLNRYRKMMDVLLEALKGGQA